MTRTVLSSQPPPPGGFGPFTAQQVFVLHASRGFVYLTPLLMALVGIWALTFTRRDIDEGGGR